MQRTRKQDSFFSPDRGATAGFTLIEIMLVVGVMAIILAMGIPPMAKTLRREPLRQAGSDFMEALAQARAQAILQGTSAEMIIAVDEERGAVVLRVLSSASQGNSRPPGEAHLEDGSPGGAARTSPATRDTFRVTLPDAIRITFLDVNFTDQLQSQAEDVRVRFFPNGTSDDFTVVIEDNSEKRKISVDPITGLADLEVRS